MRLKFFTMFAAVASLALASNSFGADARKVLVEEGKIVSADVQGGLLVLRATVEARDTFLLDKAAEVIKPEKANPTVRDLEQDSRVRVHYRNVQGTKVASTIISLPAHRQEVPPPIIQGIDMIVAEGTIRAIDNSANTMIISAQLEAQDTFALDKSAVISAGQKVSTLDEARNFAFVTIRYTLDKGRKFIREIIRSGGQSRKEDSAGK
jgi:hypothetical protein